ncbi:hypothetical protein BGW42_005299 [Actinomortierella wolfii]|nr:hypothetical protein BGW42_005299 [Actinomortierella wolfii]
MDSSKPNGSPSTDMTPLNEAKVKADPAAWQDPYTMPVPSFDSFPVLEIPSFQAPPIASSTGMTMGSRSPERSKYTSTEKSNKHSSRTEEDDSWSRRRDQDNANRVPATFSPSKEGTWIMDVKGDNGNLKYGFIDSHAVPKYSRAGGGRILGAPLLRIDYEKTREAGRGIVTKQISNLRSKPIRYSHPAAQLLDSGDEHKISKTKIAALAQLLNEQDAHGNGSFISLDVRKKTASGVRRGDDDEEIDESESEDTQTSKLPDYRDIHGFTKPSQSGFDTDIMEQGNAEDAVMESKMDRLLRERLRLDNDLRRDPKQPSQWLAFIAVNNEIDLLSTKRSRAARLKGSAHSLSHMDIVLSMFERALQANPTDSGLLLNYLNCARLVWEPAKLLDKWDEILGSDAIQREWPAAWIEYLNFRQRHFHSFTVSTLVRVVSDGLASLGRRARLLAQGLTNEGLGNNKSAEDAARDRQLLIKIENVMVHIQARAWMFLREAGYVERAYGIIQAEVEFLYHAPEGLHKEPLPIQMASMEEYWDSELPRFSESGAKGWAYYVAQEEEVEMNDMMSSIQLTQDTQQEDAEMIEAIANKDVDRQRYRQWARREQEWGRKYWFPIRTTDEIPAFMEDDPYGIILFEDVEPFLISLYSLESRRLYLDCVLHFAGLPVMTCSGSNTLPSGTLPHPLVQDGLLHSISKLQPDGTVLNSGVNGDVDLLNLSHYLPPRLSAQLEVEEVLKEVEMMQLGIEPSDRDWNSVIWRHPLAVFPMAVDNLFTGTLLSSMTTSPRSNLPWAGVFQDGDAKTVNKTFLAPSLEQLSNVGEFSRQEKRSYGLLLLVLESASTKSSSKGQKMAKKLLKHDRMDLELWNAYAQMEKSFGRIAEARRVYITALSMYTSFPDEYQNRAPLLYRSFAELEWEQGRRNVALAILVAMAHPTEKSHLEALEKTATTMDDLSAAPSPTMLARARQILTQKVAQLSLVRPDPMRTIQDDTTGQTTNSGNHESTGRWFDPSLDLIICLALFEYLAPSAGQRQQIQAAIRVFEQVLQQLGWRYPDDMVPVFTSAENSTLQPSSRRRTFGAASTLFHEGLSSMERSRDDCGVEAEMVWTQMIKFVYWHNLQATTKQDCGESNSGGGGYRLGELRRLVELGLARFPNNSILQSIYFWTEAKQRISGRVRTWILEHAKAASRGHSDVGEGTKISDSQANKSTPSVSPRIGVSPAMSNIWMFGLFYELWHQARYNIHSIRALMDAALGQPHTPLSSTAATIAGTSNPQELLFPAMYSPTSTPLLWRLYIELELREAQAEYERQMQSYQQSVQAWDAQKKRQNKRKRHHKRRRHDSDGSSIDDSQISASESDGSDEREEQSGSSKRRRRRKERRGRGSDDDDDDRDGNRSSKAKTKTSLPKPPVMSTRPKDLLLRALQDCPWCKDLYLLAFLHPQMRTLFSAAEMEQLYRTMLEKELRVHQDLPLEESSQQLMQSLNQAVNDNHSQTLESSKGMIEQ